MAGDGGGGGRTYGASTMGDTTRRNLGALIASVHAGRAGSDPAGSTGGARSHGGGGGGSRLGTWGRAPTGRGSRSSRPPSAASSAKGEAARPALASQAANRPGSASSAKPPPHHQVRRRGRRWPRMAAAPVLLLLGIPQPGVEGPCTSSKALDGRGGGGG